MAVYTIGDTHLSLGCDKPMDVFRGWSDYVNRLFSNWNATVKDEDTVVIVGDVSWGMTLEQALPDLEAINSLPGKKIIVKGNHDYWWATRKKMDNFVAVHRLDTINFLFNDAYEIEGKVICGTRGWMYEENSAENDLVFARECGRLESSLAFFNDSAAEKIVFIHYPPIFGGVHVQPIIDIMKKHGVLRCYYGHLHGIAAANAFCGTEDGITYRLVSADKLEFRPLIVK